MGVKPGHCAGCGIPLNGPTCPACIQKAKVYADQQRKKRR